MKFTKSIAMVLSLVVMLVLGSGFTAVASTGKATTQPNQAKVKTIQNCNQVEFSAVDYSVAPNDVGTAGFLLTDTAKSTESTGALLPSVSSNKNTKVKREPDIFPSGAYLPPEKNRTTNPSVQKADRNPPNIVRRN